MKSTESTDIREMSVNEIELTVQAANALNDLRLTTVGELLDNSAIGGEYSGLKGSVKNTNGVAVNFELATKLFHLEVIPGIDHLKKPASKFNPPDHKRLVEIQKFCTVPFFTPLSNVVWPSCEDTDPRTVMDFILLREHREIKNLSHKLKVVLDLILHYIRVDNQNRLVLRTWGYDGELEYNLLLLIEPQLEEWGVLDPNRKNKKKLVRKISSHEKSQIEHEANIQLRLEKKRETEAIHKPETIRRHVDTYYLRLGIRDLIQTLHDRIFAWSSNYVSEAVECMWKTVSEMITVEELLRSLPLVIPFDELPEGAKSDMKSCSSQIVNFKKFFTPELKEKIKSLIPLPGPIPIENLLLLLEASYLIDRFYLQNKHSLFEFKCLEKYTEKY